jgi:hypothetical protein
MDLKHLIGRCASVALMLVLGIGLRPASAVGDASVLCDAAAQDAARATGVPEDVLLALTRTETGRAAGGALRPWPWAINQAGAGTWFATEDEMLSHIDGLIAAGVTNFDVGCFQLNYRWHGARFASMDDMADPGQNARYAAGYLADKFATAGNWAAAAAAYHSGTPEFAARYRARFQDIHAALDGGSDPVAASPTPPADRPNLFPLLVAGRTGGGGSLVPMVDARRRLIGGDQAGNGP